MAELARQALADYQQAHLPPDARRFMVTATVQAYLHADNASDARVAF